MKVELVDPRFGGGSTITTEPRAQRIADAIVFYEWAQHNDGDTVTVYEIVHKYGLADILGSYSYAGRKPINVADQVVRNALNEFDHVVRTDARRRGYAVYEWVW